MLPNVKENKAVRLRGEARRFHATLAWLKWLPFLHHYASAVRNTYNAVQEAPDWTIARTPFKQLLRENVRHILSYLSRVPHFEPKSPITMLSIHPIIDEPVANMMGLPITPIRYERSFAKASVAINAVNLILPLAAWALLLLAPKLKWRAVVACLPDLLDYTLVIRRLNLGAVKVVITHRDRYGSEVGLMRLARKQGIPTIKVDYYSPLDAFCQNTIEAEYFFYPNDNNRGIYERYPHNKHVKFVPGGLPKWDLIGKHTHAPKSDPKIVLFMGQYDIEQFTGIDERFYIAKILDYLPAGYRLYIKPHPSEEFSRYEEFAKRGARLIAHGEIDNYELIAQSTICFSVYSAMLYEAKHLCPQSYVINFFPELAPHVEYDFLSQYVDHVKTEEMLIEVLNGRFTPLDVEGFIRKFNSTFPASSLALLSLAKSLAGGESDQVSVANNFVKRSAELPSTMPH